MAIHIHLKNQIQYSILKSITKGYDGGILYLVSLVLWTSSFALYVPYEHRVYWFRRWSNIFSAESRGKNSSWSPSQ